MDGEQSVVAKRAVGEIRSALKTLTDYRKASMALQDRPLGSVRLFAAALQMLVQDAVDMAPADPEVLRWQRKFDDFVHMHNLSVED